MIPQVDLFLFVFWEKLKTPKRHFEINWPLRAYCPNIYTLPAFKLPESQMNKFLWFMQQQSMRAPELPRNCSHSHSIHATYAYIDHKHTIWRSKYHVVCTNRPYFSFDTWSCRANLQILNNKINSRFLFNSCYICKHRP